jgi:DNA primase
MVRLETIAVTRRQARALHHAAKQRAKRTKRRSYKVYFQRVAGAIPAKTTNGGRCANHQIVKVSADMRRQVVKHKSKGRVKPLSAELRKLHPRGIACYAKTQPRRHSYMPHILQPRQAEGRAEAANKPILASERASNIRVRRTGGRRQTFAAPMVNPPATGETEEQKAQRDQLNTATTLSFYNTHSNRSVLPYQTFDRDLRQQIQQLTYQEDRALYKKQITEEELQRAQGRLTGDVKDAKASFFSVFGPDSDEEEETRSTLIERQTDVQDAQAKYDSATEAHRRIVSRKAAAMAVVPPTQLHLPQNQNLYGYHG